jgi:coenzyme F420-reducing hydrogenase delta subunit/NAD-dependent dihydropyrimidine dehydrogenase PreA subunit
MNEKPRVVVIGDGPCATAIGRRLSECRVAVCLTARTPDPQDLDTILRNKGQAEWLPGAQVVACRGFAGNFEIDLRHDGRPVTRRVGAVVVALDPAASPNHDLYGLAPNPTVLSISQAEALWNAAPVPALWPTGAMIAFVNGIQRESHPAMSARMLGLCRTMQQHGAWRTCYLTGNLKVADDALEEVCHAAKSAGTIFYKFSRKWPAFAPLPDGKTRIDAWDESLRLPIDMTVDGVVVDETIAASAQLGHLARVFHLEVSPEGFLQGANVRRLSNATNRHGIFVADGARGVLGPDERDGEAERVAAGVLHLFDELAEPALSVVTIDPLRCGKCLTCYRTCPYCAIRIDDFISVIPEACQHCGLCVAACPARAIDIQGDPIETALVRLSNAFEAQNVAGPFRPKVVVFGCERSAAQARQTALSSGQSLPDDLIFIDGVCGGSFSSRHLMAAIDRGADGVMLLTCHNGNCHSGQGGTTAKRGSTSTLAALAQVGIGAERIFYGTLSANMGSEFARLVNDFYQSIQRLGPWGL